MTAIFVIFLVGGSLVVTLLVTMRRKVEPPTKPTPAPPASAAILLSFGARGSGPGRFSNAESVAVDANGTIYVGDYNGGCVQVFGPDGKFIALWFADTKMPMPSMAVDRKGTVYAVQDGRISRYDGLSGKMIGTPTPNHEYENVVALPDGSLLVWQQLFHGNIVLLDGNLRPTLTVEKAIGKQTDDKANFDTGVHLAADGQFNIYALSGGGGTVFKFARDGRFLNRFGSPNNGLAALNTPAQLTMPSSIAVDGQGRVYVSEGRKIKVFDTSGQYLKTIDLTSSARLRDDEPTDTVFNVHGMTFNDQGDLFVAASNRVLKLKINR
jgi:sugar lactone lactonase YvrE